MLLRREMDSGQLLTLYFTLTQIFSGGKAKIYLHTMLQFTVFMSISCPMRSRRILILNVATSAFAPHARYVINWERNFKENIIKKYLGERIRKEVVIIRIESSISVFH